MFINKSYNCNTFWLALINTQLINLLHSINAKLSTIKIINYINQKQQEININYNKNIITLT